MRAGTGLISHLLQTIVNEERFRKYKINRY